MYYFASRPLIRFASKPTLLLLLLSIYPACKTSTHPSASDSDIKGTETLGLNEVQENKFTEIFFANARAAIMNGGTVPALLAKKLQTGLLKARSVAGGYPNPFKLKEIFITTLINSDALAGNDRRSAHFPDPKDPTNRDADIRVSRVIKPIFMNVINQTNNDYRNNPSPELKELSEVLAAISWSDSGSKEVF